MDKKDFAHEAAELLEIYGHILRKMELATSGNDPSIIPRIYGIMKKHRSRMIKLLQDTHNHLCRLEVEDD